MAGLASFGRTLVPMILCALPLLAGAAPAASSETHVYLGGGVGTLSSDDQGTELTVPCEWTDGKLTLLPMTGGNLYGEVYGVAVDPFGAPYFAGYMESRSKTDTPWLWTADSATRLPTGTDKDGHATSVMIDAAGNIYVTGEVGGHGCYWKNGALKLLPLGQGRTYAGANAVTVDATGNVLIAGQVGVSASDSVPCVWKGGTLALLPLKNGGKKGEATAVSAVGTDVFIAGTDGDVPCYWKNGVQTLLHIDEKGGYASVIVAQGGAIWIGGSEGDTACYWKNGKAVPLPDNGDTPAVAYDAEVDPDGTTRFAGYITPSDNGDVSRPAYWEDEELTILPLGSKNTTGEVFALAVGGQPPAAAGTPAEPGSSIPITADNWLNHPQIVAIRGIVTQVDALVGGQKLSSRRQQQPYVDADTDTSREAFTDSEGVIRKLVRTSGPSTAVASVTYYYSPVGHLRFAYVQAASANQTHLQDRIYWDDSGARIWEIQKKVDGPGDAFPEQWPIDDVMFDPDSLPLDEW